MAAVNKPRLLPPPDGALCQFLLGRQELGGGGGGGILASRRLRLLLSGAAVPARSGPVQELIRAAGALAGRVQPAHRHAGEPHLHPAGRGAQQPGDLPGLRHLAGLVQMLAQDTCPEMRLFRIGSDGFDLPLRHFVL